MASRMTAKAFIGSEIRRAREAAGMSRAKLAKPLMISESLIVAWECGRQGILPEHMKRILGIQPDGTHGQPLLQFPPEFIIRLIEKLVNGETKPEFENKWLSAEALAACLWCYEVYVITGYLQTRAYARAVLDDEDSLNLRMERQKILSSVTTPQLVAIISENALRNNVGGRAVMAEQLEHLAGCAEQDNDIIVSIIPADSPICAKFRVPFTIATLDNGKEVAYTNSSIRGEVIEQAEDIITLKKLFDQYRADALRTDESINLIRRIAEQWKA